MKLLAVIRDGFREAKDRRISTILFALSLLVAGVCASIRFEPFDGDLTIAAREALRSGPVGWRRPDYSVETRGARAVVVRFAQEREKDMEDAERSLRGNGFATERDGPLIHARVEDPYALPGGKMHVLFGAGTIDLPGFSPKKVVTIIELVLATNIAGWLGIIIAIIVTSGFVPSMVQSGSIHTLLAKPVRRSTYILGKYLGGIVFVLFHATVLIGLSWAAFAWRLAWWDPRFLLLIPCVAAIFSVVYSVSVLAGVIFESPMLAALLSLGFWAGCAVVGGVHDAMGMSEMKKLPPWVHSAIDTVYTILPKTHDLDQIAQKLVRPDFAMDLPEEFGAVIIAKDYTFSLLSTGAFTAVVIALACLIFWRRDY